MKKGAVVIVTGGNGVIGGAIAERIRSCGADPVIFDLKTPDGYEVDITDYVSVEAAVRSVVEKYGHVDGLVNCAGGSARGEMRLFTEQKIEVIKRILEVNLFGTFYCTRAVVPYLIGQKSGVILNVSSAVALGGLEGCSDYGAAKGGVIAATKAWAMEFGPWNIRVNCVCPGKVQRPDEMPADPRTFARRYCFLNRLCTPEDIASAAEFLLDDGKSGFVTGQNYVVDGGRSLGLKGDHWPDWSTRPPCDAGREHS